MFRSRSRVLKPAAAAILFVLTVALVASCGGPSFSQGITNVFDADLQMTMAANKIPGSVAGVWVPSRGTWLVPKGKADVQANSAMKMGDKFRIASITKTFTATQILILADQGKLNLDDKLAKYYPNLPNAQNITIRQLLNHTSGVHDDDPAGVWNAYFAHTDQMLRRWTPEEDVQNYTGGKVQGEPGKAWQYSNCGYVELGMVIEKVSGMSVPDFIQKSIAKPLGLKNTYMPVGPEITGDYAHGYDGTVDVTKMDMSWDFTAGAMISNAEDLKVWSRALATGQLLSPKMHKEQLTWVEIPNSKGNARYGLGIEYQFGWLGHGGANVGYQCEMWYLPKADSPIVVEMNKLSSDSSDLAAAKKAFMRLADTAFPGTFPAWYKKMVGL